MKGNVTHASFQEARLCETPALYQFDYGQKLVFDNVELPESYEVIFSNGTIKDGKIAIGNSEGVIIPDEYLQSGCNIMAWIFLHEGEYDGEVEYVVRIPVRPRSKLSNEQITDEEHSIVSDLIAAVDDLHDTVDSWTETDPTVPEWAKEQTKPSYTPQEVGAMPADTFIPTRISDLLDDSGHYIKPSGGIPESDIENGVIPHNVSELNNDVGYITGFTETDPTVPAWAKQPNKPSYTSQEIGALPDDTFIPSNISDLQNDVGFITGYTETDPTVPSWAKQPTKPTYTAQEVGALPNDTTLSDLQNDAGFVTASAIPNKVSDLVNDAGYITEVQDALDYIAQPFSDDPEDYYTYGRVVSRNGKLYMCVSQTYTTGGTFVANDWEEKTASEIWAAEDDRIYNAIDRIHNEISNINGMDIHICTAAEYNAQTGIPTVSEPDTQTFYLVPGGEGNNLFVEWAYVNSAWERFGGVDVEVPVTDVQVNGTSIVNNGVANIQKAGSNNLGVVGIELQSGVNITSSGKLEINPASIADIKKGENTNKPIAPFTQEVATFYGLAKAAGDETMSTSSNAVGTYTNEAKAAIKSMLGVTDPTVSDVQMNGSSIVSNGVATVPIANASGPGVAYFGAQNGLAIDSSGVVTINAATESNIKTGTNRYKPVVPLNQGQAVFYGLATAAGDTTQAQSSNAFGTYTQDAKAAIQTMLDVPSTSDIPTVPVQDVQINGTSILSSGTANIPVSSAENAGVAKTSSSFGIGMLNSGVVTNTLAIVSATSNQIKSASDSSNASYYRPIVPITQHEATFYGLAKAAGDTTQSQSSNAVGTYTAEAKAAIKAMLGVVDGSTGTVDVTGTTPTITAVENKRYVCGEVATLTITPPASGICIVRFTSGTTATVFTATGVVWPEWFDATALEAERVYEICITDGYGMVMSWAL